MKCLFCDKVLMEREIFITEDGSSTIRLPQWDEQYHSKHGAIQEAEHVFIQSGLNHYISQHPSVDSLRILEIGFGTGLNALLTALHHLENDFLLEYTGLEAYPVQEGEWQLLNYAEVIPNQLASKIYTALHKIEWESFQKILPNFLLRKKQMYFQEFHELDQYNLIYFDAFGARVQPELWEESIFRNMYNALQDNGVLVTYSAKGSVRRAMLKVGFEVEKIPGPPGKREMLRATKTN